MRFLLPVGGIVDPRFGILTTPGHAGIPAGIVAGMDWAADNEAFTRGFDPDRFFPWLNRLAPHRACCLFIPVPDVVSDAAATTANYWQWMPHFTGWPLAFVAQDGQEDLAFPSDEWQVLFIGGSTEWKLSIGAESCIKRAQAMGKRIHIGRVNWWKRYAHFRAMEGSDEWTCDGTRTRYEGTKRTVEAWADYMERSYQLHLPILGGDHRS
jgi:hypothetical protein